MLLPTRAVQASVKFEANFQASQACEAFQSLKKGTNPGNVAIVPDRIYAVIEKNKKDATHYRLTIDEADPKQRWVASDCGEIIQNERSENEPGPVFPKGEDNVLAISWQPAFCETHSKKEECKAQIATRFDAQNFTLHGLFPEPQYCNVSDETIALDQPDTWLQLPSIELSEALFEELQIKMPGVASGLHLHEWYKHGTCYSDTPEEYFHESLRLLDQVNASPIRTLFASNIGRDVTANDIRDNFTETFAHDAGKKVSVKCNEDRVPNRRTLIQELKLNLNGDIATDTELSNLFMHGKTTGRDCKVGEVDRAGLN